MNTHGKTRDRLVLREKLIISPRNASASEWPLPRILKTKASRGTKVFFGGILYPLFDLLSFLFLLTISRPPPPGVCQNKKSPSHLWDSALSTLLDLPPLPESRDRPG